MAKKENICSPIQFEPPKLVTQFNLNSAGDYYLSALIIGFGSPPSLHLGSGCGSDDATSINSFALYKGNEWDDGQGRRRGRGK